MLYLSRFCFPGWEKEESFRWSISRTCYDSFYPFGVLSKVDFRQIDFEPVTILYGGNGSGKTTALNVIAEKLHLVRDTLYNRSNFWDDYLRYCEYEPENSLSPEKQMELVRLIEDCVRFFGCQVIIASHSPFILSMRYAKIYDLDEQPVDVKKWTELRNVRTYYDFFKEH